MNKTIKKHMENGVIFVNPESIYVDETVIIGKDTTILQGCMIRGNTIIGKNCEIGMNSEITDAIIGDDSTIKLSVVRNSKVGNNTNVGPYSQVRKDSVIGNNVWIGNFIEVKASTIGNNSESLHHAYIGDAEIGERVNIGCGTVFVNFDGRNSQKTIVEDDVFIGCNVNLVAPLILRKNSFIAAGSTITENVESKSLAIARSRQVNKVGWVK
ncbi:MAG: hypothetical protein N4A47_07635 [Clostridia bacterium]|nr:hypothetical protein [Clostridia bacterium]